MAVDVHGDGIADSWSGETIESCVGCRPFEAVDLNGDGREELIVVQSYFSIMQYGLYTSSIDGGGPRGRARSGVASQGIPSTPLDAGKPFTFWVGGDAGLSDWFYCETLPEFWLTGTESPIDG